MKNIIENEIFWFNKLNGTLGFQFFEYMPKSKQSLKTVEIDVKNDLIVKLNEVCKNSELYKFIFLSCAFSCYESLFSQKKEIIVPVSSTDKLLDDETFSDIIFLKTIITENTTFKELFKNSINQVKESINRQNISLDKLSNRLGIERSELLNVVFTYDGVSSLEREIQPDTHIVFDEKSRRLNIASTELDIDSLELFGAYYQNLLVSILENIDIKVSDIDVLLSDDIQQLSQFSRNMSNETYKRSVIDELSERNTSERLALIYGENRWTYKELVSQYQKMSHFLSDYNLPNQSVISVYLEKSDWMVISQLAIMNTGHIYLPIDVDAPEDRLNTIVQNSESKYLLTSKSYQSSLNDVDIPIIYIEDFIEKQINIEYKHFQAAGLIDHSAYILYTSGSTGVPKGVLISHHNLISRLHAERDLYDLDENMASIQLTNYAFDVSFLEILLPLMVGGTVIVPNMTDLMEPEKIHQIIETHNITDVQGAPSYVHFLFETMFNRELSSIKRFCIGGESLKDETLQLLKKTCSKCKSE